MGTVRLMGDVSGYLDIKSGDTPASQSLILPPSQGANNQVLTSNGANKQVWSTPSALEGFRGVIRSHPDSDVVNSKIRADLTEVVFSNGKRFVPATGLVFDKSGTGSINGMQAAAANSTWNKLYYLRKSSDGSEGLWGLRTKNYGADQSQTTDNTSDALRVGATDRVKLAQGFQVTTSGLLEFVDVNIHRNASPVGNIWYTIEADSAGNPSGTPLATSDKYDAARFATAGTAGIFQRFPFRTPVSLVAATQYHLVLQGDYTVSGTNNIVWHGNTGGGYANGSAKKFDGTTWTAATNSVDFVFKLYITQNDTALAAPSGYDQAVQIGWFYIDSSGNIKNFMARDRRVYTSASVASWKYVSTSSGAPILTDLSAFIPPLALMVHMGSSATVTGARLSISHICGVPRPVLETGYFQTTIGSIAASDGDGVNAHGSVFLEYQACMNDTDTNTLGGFVEGFEW